MFIKVILCVSKIYREQRFLYALLLHCFVQSFGQYNFYGRLKFLCVLYKYSNTQLVIWYEISYEE